MKLVWVGIALLVATISVGVGCGPKEKYCYEDMDTCANVQGKKDQDAMFEAGTDADDAGGCTMFTLDGGSVTVPCPG